MAELTKKTIPGIGSGILQPVLANRWRCRIQNQDEEWEQLLAMQIVSVTADYKAKTLTLILEQNLNTMDMHMAISDMVSKLIPVCVETLDGRTDKPSSAVQYNCRLADHTFELNYANSGAAQHVLVFDIKEMIQYEPAQPDK